MSMPDLLLCSGVDGVIYTITFNISIFVGVLSAIGLVVHEFAEGVITYLFLIKSGVSKKLQRYTLF